MTQELIETAINHLKLLLDKSSSNIQEKDFQDYFVKNPIVFRLLGYKNAYPHVHLHSEKSVLIPDFILQKENGLFEICDIKLPNEKIIRQKKNREEFYSKVGGEYAGQLRNYSTYFDDSINRQYVQERYNINVNKVPDRILIIGRNENINKHKIHEILTSRSHEFKLVTYDDVLENLIYSLDNSYISEKQFFGTSFLILLQLELLGNSSKQFIVDLGDDENQNRFSIFLSENKNLCFCVIDEEGNNFSITIPRTLDKLDLTKYFYLHCSVGCSDDYSIMELYLNGLRVEKREFTYRLFGNRGLSFKRRFFASDITKNNGSAVRFELIKAFNHNLNLFDRSIEDNYFFRRLKWVNSIVDICHVFYDEKAYGEILYRYGQKSTLPPGVEGVWDVNDFYIKGVPVSAHRKAKGEIFEQ